MSLPTAADCRAHLEGYCLTTSVLSDAWINDELNGAVIPFVNEYCRTDVSTAQSVIEYYSGNGTTILILNRRNITVVTAAEIVRGEPFLTQISLNSFDLLPREGILKAKKNINEGMYFTIFPKGVDNIKITYTYGGTCPDDLSNAIKKLTCISILDNIEGRTGGGSLGIQNFQRDFGNMGRYSNIRKRLHAQAMYTLKKYATYSVGA